LDRAAKLEWREGRGGAAPGRGKERRSGEMGEKFGEKGEREGGGTATDCYYFALPVYQV